jgi:hypothetical protein
MHLNLIKIQIRITINKRTYFLPLIAIDANNRQITRDFEGKLLPAFGLN